MCIPGLPVEKARSEAMSVFAGLPETVASAHDTVPGTAAPSTRNCALLMVWPASGEMVACRSKRWPGRNRAMMGGLGSLWLNKALGGVKRVTLGAASASLRQDNATAAKGMA